MPSLKRLCWAAALLMAVAIPSASAWQADRTRNPHGPLPVSCEACHTATAWKPARAHPEFNHNTQTAYPLRDMHTNVACGACHVSQVFRNTPHDCAGCHADLHRSRMGVHCEQCHTVRGWRPARQISALDHSNRFPLLGAHARVQCESCHQGGANAIFTGMSTECIVCHRSDFQTTQNPPHQQASFPLNCAVCHSMNNWLGAKFDHAALANFPLTGAHATLPCAACHIGGKFTGTPAACISCHQADLQSATNPNHIASGFPTDCSQCHNTSNWTTTTFNHATTVFPLTGAHVTVPCASCHLNNNFNTIPTDCYSCHTPDFTGAQNPNHVTAGFPTTCATCHNTTTWTTSTFDHNAVSGFPLTGTHATTPCTQCHTGGSFATAPRVCSGCHLTDYNKTTTPNHAQASFPTDCSLCHSTVDWTGATFNHSTTTFPLTGAHQTVACAQCHVNNNYTTIPTNCDACHLTEFNQTTSPNHVQASFPVNCSLCHSTTNWTGSTFNHATTAFPLTGAHTTVPCASCHVANNYTTVPTDCYSCHKADYTGVQNPNHLTSGFPTTCATCHTTTTWAGATFNHTWFPIYSGNHAHVWTTCGDCHLDPSNYSSFTCINCHTHTQSATDPRHSGVRGYTYAPTSCYQCHPRG
jgi:hypothetical protein